MPQHLPLSIFLTLAFWTQQPYTKVPPRPAAHHRATTKPKAAAPVAYYCASGNIVKYHASPTCEGLYRCNASVDRIALSTAQARMQPCRVCH